MKKDQLDLENWTVWIPDSKTPSGIAESADGHRGGRFPASACALRSGLLSVPERCNCGRLSKDVQDRLACDIASGRGSILSPVRSPLHVRDLAQCRGRCRRVG